MLLNRLVAVLRTRSGRIGGALMLFAASNALGMIVQYSPTRAPLATWRGSATSVIVIPAPPREAPDAGVSIDAAPVVINPASKPSVSKNTSAL
jgi:hypothetical protein